MANATEHDQRFKELLREFFAEFLTLFFPGQAAELDFATVEWLDKELFNDPPSGVVQEVDLVARVRFADGTDRLLLLHTEVESGDSASRMPERMYRYALGLDLRYELPVLPVAVYLSVGYDGVSLGEYVRSAGSFETLRYRYLYVGLPALDGAAYRAGENWLGVALSALMRVPRDEVPLARAEALRRIVVECPENDYRKRLLIECVERYLELGVAQRSAFLEVLARKEYQAVRQVGLTTFEEGQLKGRRAMLRDQLEVKFGPLSEAAAARLDLWTDEQLRNGALTLLAARSLADLGLADETLPHHE